MSATPAPPPAARHLVPGNRWDLLDPSAVDAQDAPLVSICIPTRNGGETLERTLTMLALQTHPAARLQVVVADDGSDPPLDLSSLTTPYELVVVRQEPDGFGAGRARNLAASRADGEMLVFLDADVIPEPTVIDQYVRWMSANTLSVPFGFSRFVDWPDVPDDVMAERLVDETMDDVFPSDDVDSQEYREPYLAATHDLLDERLDLFRVFVAATFGVGADLYRSVGGFRELGVRGVEDIELGYRLSNQGALLIPVRTARHWHQGRRTMSGERLQEIRRRRQPYVERLLPVGGFRSGRPLGRAAVPVVPRFAVEIVDGDQTLASATSTQLAALPASDVQVVDAAVDADRSVFADVRLPAGLAWSERTAEELIAVFEETPTGTVKLVGDTHPPVVITRRRATSRVRNGAGDPPTDRVVESLFGVRAVLASDVGVYDIREGAPEPEQRHRQALGRVSRRIRHVVRTLADEHPD